MSTPPAGLQAKFLAACGVFTCAIKPDDGVACWGLHPPAPPADLKALHIAVENDGANHQGQAELSTISRHACAVKLDHTVTCWGDNNYHQLDVPTGILAKQVAVGTTHSCALLLDGQVRCWGRVASPAGLRAKSIAANHFAACAIKEDDTVYCWAARFGQEQANGARVLAPGE